MAKDPKARRMTVAYSKGTVTASLGLLGYLFGDSQPSWGEGSIGTTARGRRRYKYGSKQKSNAAAGKEVFLDLGEDGVYCVRVTGDVIDFVDRVASKAGTKVKRMYTRRGTIYAPTLENI